MAKAFTQREPGKGLLLFLLFASFLEVSITIIPPAPHPLLGRASSAIVAMWHPRVRCQAAQMTDLAGGAEMRREQAAVQQAASTMASPEVFICPYVH